MRKRSLGLSFPSNIKRMTDEANRVLGHGGGGGGRVIDSDWLIKPNLLSVK